MKNLPRYIASKARKYPDQCIGYVVDFLQYLHLLPEFSPDEITTFGPVIQVTHTYPLNYKEKDQAHFITWKTYQTLPFELFRVTGARVTHEGAVLKGLLPFIPALPHPVFRFKFGLLSNLHTRLRYRKCQSELSDRHVLIYDFWSKSNYYHWCIDSLCRLWMTQEFLKDGYVLLLPGNAPDYINQSAVLFGIANICYIPPSSVLHLKELDIMNYSAGSGRHHPEILKKVRQYLLSTLPVSNSQPTRKVYVSRGKQSSRRISNELELIPFLTERGFEVIYFEGMSIGQQIKIMRETTFFLSSHGANMTNCLFLQEHSTVLELINDCKPNFCYWSVCASIDIDYYYLLCPIASLDHIRVNIDELEQTLVLAGCLR
jgi:hypothetical protein